jgi:formylglycine-generating enzyme required for sulfatase activity
LPKAVLAGISGRWLARMTDPEQEPHPHARAAIGRALGRFGLDRRKGVGLRADGLPDIDWVRIPGEHPFVYQDGEVLQLPTFHIARYLITHAQFQAFIDAGGYRQDMWWQGLAKRFNAPRSAAYNEPNAPRETVSWYEAVAFCRWLSGRLGYPITLPIARQWERAARGTQGLEYPWGEGYRSGYANCNELLNKRGPYGVHRTTAVGLYPQGASPEAVLDLAGNVWEWCLNEYGAPKNTQLAGGKSRVLRGGSLVSPATVCRAWVRFSSQPVDRDRHVGFRVCCGAAIETLDAGTRITGSLKS